MDIEKKIIELEARIKNIEDIQTDVLDMLEFLAKRNNIISSLNYGQAAAALHISSKIRHREKITEKDILDLIIKNKK